MNDKVKRVVADLRRGSIEQQCWECSIPCDINRDHCMIEDAADLIESLAAELEQVKQERDGLSIMLTAAQSAAETYKRERDAAVKDLRDKDYGCEKCKHFLVAPGKVCNLPREMRKHSFGCWEWRGVREET